MLMMSFLILMEQSNRGHQGLIAAHIQYKEVMWVYQILIILQLIFLVPGVVRQLGATGNAIFFYASQVGGISNSTGNNLINNGYILSTQSAVKNIQFAV